MSDRDSIMTNSRVLVTGGAGFIGCNLCERLLQQDNEVVCLDNFSTGKRSNIERFKANHRFSLIEGDIRDLEICAQAADGIDYVLHQAALGSVPRSVKDPMTSTEVNITGFVNMLFAAKEAKVKRFVYASSSSVYGDHPVLPKLEEQIGKQLSPYAITKYTNELFARNFSEIYGIETVGLRYFNVFGPWQDPDGPYAAVIPKWILLMLKEERPLIHGDGMNSRDFTYIENVLQVNQLAATSIDHGPRTTGDKQLPSHVYNIACGERTTLTELFYYLRERLKIFKPDISDLEPVYGPVREGDITHSLADISKAQKELEYKPVVKVKVGIEKTCDWFCKQA